VLDVYALLARIKRRLAPSTATQTAEKNMKFKATVLLSILFLFSSLAMADEASHRAAAEELLLLMNVDEMVKPVFEQVELMMEQQFDQSDAPEESRPILKKYTGKMMKILEEELSWEKMKDDYVDIYVRTYTEDEIRAIADFYKTPAGQAFIEKMPKLMQEAMALSQRSMQGYMHKIEQLSSEMAKELEEAQERSNDNKGSAVD
jgi:hypothetical protein